VFARTPEMTSEVRVPKSAKVDDRTRVILNEAEFERFMACQEVSPELAVMTLISRTFGGMRTSDLHAWDRSHIDGETWADAHVPRPSVGRWRSSPTRRLRRGPRGLASARSCRGDQEREGQERQEVPPVGRTPSRLAAIGETERRARACCLIQAGSAELKPLDFHSFRRAFNTALADVGLNIQTAMRLAGHKNAGTHMRYVMIAETLITPTGALPKLSKTPALPVSEKARALPKVFGPANGTSVFSAHPSGFEPLTYGSRGRRRSRGFAERNAISEAPCPVCVRARATKAWFCANPEAGCVMTMSLRGTNVVVMSSASKSQARPRETLNIRIRAEERGLIDRAAAARGTNRTDFILDAARRAAEDTLLDQVMISVGTKAYAEFLARLDAPAKPNERLRRTMKKPLPWKVG
jgi:uncharacterized protein (DUF1778 family)